MSLSSSYCQPLYEALLQCDMKSLTNLADNLSLDMEVIGKIIYFLSDYSRQGCHITPLQAAVMTGNYRICKHLVSEGSYLFSLSYHMSHPLNIALDTSRFQIAKLLITSGADVSLPQHGFYPLYFAIKPESPKYIVEAIIKAGFPPTGVIEEVCFSTPLHRAVACNNVPVVKLLMKYKISFNATDSHQGYTAIHIAVQQRLPHLVKLLAENGAKIDLECKEGYTPLFYAIMYDDLECLQILLQFGANMHHMSSVKMIFPLNMAVSLCHEEITEYLIKQGVNVKAIDLPTGNSVLHSAVTSQRGKTSEEIKIKLIRIVHLLIERGSEVGYRNKYGYTPIQLAIKEENFELVEVLVQAGAAVNCALDQGTNFHFVSKLGTKELVNMFLEYGADYNAVDENGITPYHSALLNHDKTVFKIFWKFHCPFDQPLSENSRKLLYTPDVLSELQNQRMMMVGIKTNDVQVMYDALENGAEIKGCSVEIPYPLHFAAESGFESVVHLMLDRGVPPNSLNHYGETPLHLTARYGYYYNCLHLLKYGASYNYKTKSTGKTPMDIAKENNHHDIVCVLKEIHELFKCHSEKYENNCSGYNSEIYGSLVLFINCINKNGDTLLSRALKKGFNELTSCIMKLRLHEKESFEV